MKLPLFIPVDISYVCSVAASNHVDCISHVCFAVSVPRAKSARANTLNMIEVAAKHLKTHYKPLNRRQALVNVFNLF